MWLTKLALNRPLVILMAAAALALLGMRALFQMPAELNPRVDIPFITVVTVYPGASPEQVESTISEPLEDAVGSVGGVQSIKSSSQEGTSTLELQLELGTNLDAAAADVRQKIETARQNLPHEAYDPLVFKEDINAAPVYVLGLVGNLAPTELRRIADEEVKPAFGRIKGVASVDVTGGQVREIHVDLDRDKLASYGLSADAVANALQSASLDVPAGSIQQAGRNYSIRMVGEFSSLDEIKSVGLPGPPPGMAPGPKRIVTVGDVATVTDTVQTPTEITRVDRFPSVGISITKLPAANTTTVAAQIQSEMKVLQSKLDAEQVSLVVNQDQSILIHEALQDITASLVLGALLATLVVYLFLHDLRGTLIIACAIPTSMVVTFLVMYSAGFTLNQMTMLGLSIAVGILVDDSILVLENIYRHLQRGEPPREAALNGRTEIGLADITTTLVDVVVFVPIAFMGGIVGQFFKQFGLTVATATLTSMFVSFSFTPMLASRWYQTRGLRDENTGFAGAFDRFYTRLDARYRRLLAWALSRRLKVIGIAGICLIVAFALGATQLGFEFIPTIDEGLIKISIQLPVSATLEGTDALTRKVEELVVQEKDPQTGTSDVYSMFTVVGEVTGAWRSFPQTGPQYAQITVKLREKPGFVAELTHFFHAPGRQQSDTVIAQALDARLRSEIAGATISVYTVRGIEGDTSPVELDLSGENITSLNTAAQQVRDVLQKVHGLYDIETSIQVGKPEIRVTPDRARLAALGVSVDALGSALRTSFSGNTDARFLDPTNNKSYVIRVEYAGMDRQSVDQIKRVLVSRQNGPPVMVGDVATVIQEIGRPTEIDRKDRRRMVVVAANLLPDYALGTVTKQAKRLLTKVTLPKNVDLKWGGDDAQMRTNAVFMAEALLTSIALVYMLMAALFGSMLHPLTIMLSLPMALVGAVLALVFAHTTLSIVAMIGFIMLVGMVGKNAILLVDYTNTLRARGRTTTQALMEAGPTRLRPILMTTLTVVTGMFPTALGIGRAAEMRAPMAVAVLGGLILSTLLTLVLIPVCYSLFDDVFKKL
ncbi:MAG TPA: efflux RND transporter permease subunit [Armatimonadota bacterium]|nr:efflux RND transporter permease subunit [Armatimonadota bacterium]